MRTYIFTWQHDTDERLEKFVGVLEGIGMKTIRREYNGNLNVIAQFQGKDISFEESQEKILPILRQFRIPDFAIDDGDLTVLDDKGDIISWCSGDFIIPSRN